MSSTAFSPSENGPNKIVHPGGCYLNDEFIRCALDEVHCQGLAHRSSRELRASGDPAAERCKRPHPDFVGMCTSGMDSYHCTGHSTNCLISSKFVPNVPYCSLMYNHIPDRDTHLSLYGNCVGDDGNICVWSQDDCPSSRTFSAASFSTYGGNTDIEDLCTCEKVVTGACVVGNNWSDWTCAVSADACDKDADFHNWQKVRQAGKDCRLCPAFDKTDVTKAPVGRLHPFHPRGNANFQGTGCSAGIISGTVIGGMLVALLATVVVNWVCCNRRRGETRVVTKNERDAEAESDALPSLDSQCEPVQIH